MRKMLILAVISLLGVTVSLAQNNSGLNTKLTEYFKIVRKQVYAPTPDKILYNEENAKELFELLQPYINDSTAKVRVKAYYLTYKSTYKSKDTGLREIAVYNLVQALKDEDSGNVGNVANWLSNFYSDDFHNDSKDSLKSVLHKQTLFQDRIVKLAAFAGLHDQVDYLKNNLENGTYKSNKAIWATHLALARLGVETEIDFCLNLSKKQTINDDFIYELVPDLIYTKQKKVFDYLVEILNSNTKNCYSANPENPQKILCGYRVMEYIAPVIKDFPLELDSSGDILTDDYEQALLVTRDWFKEKSGTYEIITGIY